MINYGREYVYHPVRKSGEIQPQYLYRMKEWINTELEIFQSKALAEKVVSVIGVDKLFPKLAESTPEKQQLLSKALGRFGKALKLLHVKESNVVDVSFQHRDPELAVEAVRLLIKLFKERHLQLFKNPQTSFLEQQVNLYSNQLQQAENTLKDYKQKNKIFSLEHQQQIMMDQYVRVNTMLIEARGKVAQLEERASGLAQERDKVPDEIVRTRELSKDTNDLSEAHAHASLLDLQLEERQLLEKYPEENRLVVAVRKKIALVEDFLAGQKERERKKTISGLNSVAQQLELKLAEARADAVAQKEKTAELERQQKKLAARLQELSEQEVRFRDLSLRVEAVTKTYLNFLGRLEDSRIRDAMDSKKLANVVVIEEPLVPIKPIKPRKKLNILVGLILGVACSLSYGLLIDHVMGRKQ